MPEPDVSLIILQGALVAGQRFSPAAQRRECQPFAVPGPRIAWIKLNRVLGLASPPLTLRVLMERLRVRLRAERVGGPIWWCWDLGYFVEMRRRPTDASA